MNKANTVLVIHEIDLSDNEKSVIAVVSNPEIAQQLINKYYGHNKVISYIEIRDSSLVWEKELEVYDQYYEPYFVKVWLEWFEINKL